jgi:hypothetical protein
VRSSGPTSSRTRKPVCAIAVAIAVAALPVGAALAATAPPPIQSTGPAPSLPAFIGSAAKPHPVAGVEPAWQNPFMAPNPGNSVHNDAWQSDNYATVSGPLGRRLRTLSTAIGRDCITLTFDHKGRLVGSCTDIAHGPGLYLIDPRTLATLAFRQLPFVPAPGGHESRHEHDRRRLLLPRQPRPGRARGVQPPHPRDCGARQPVHPRGGL